LNLGAPENEEILNDEEGKRSLPLEKRFKRISTHLPACLL